MRHLPLLSLLAFAIGCSSTGGGFGNEPDAHAPGSDSGSGGDSGFVPNNDSGIGNFGDASLKDAPSGADASVSTTVYANSDQTLYTLDPQTNALTLIGAFSGTSGTTTDGPVTDLAVNAAGDVYVNTESVIYKAALPTTPPGTVQLTKIAPISLQTGQKFYALAFAPAGSLDTNEVLIGGDGFGELYSIDTGTGATQHLGNFGPDKGKTGYNWALSGDLVFYLDSNNKPTGLATVRPCVPSSSTCTTSNDYLVGVDMTALATAYKTKTPAASLLAGIYGGSSTSAGAGTTFGHLFGLGAWQGKVFAFQRASSSTNPQLIEISTTTGQGSVIPSSVAFTTPDQGWSGAGVTTTVTVTVPPPPPPPL